MTVVQTRFCSRCRKGAKLLDHAYVRARRFPIYLKPRLTSVLLPVFLCSRCMGVNPFLNCLYPRFLTSVLTMRLKSIMAPTVYVSSIEKCSSANEWDDRNPRRESCYSETRILKPENCSGMVNRYLHKRLAWIWKNVTPDPRPTFLQVISETV